MTDQDSWTLLFWIVCIIDQGSYLNHQWSSCHLFASFYRSVIADQICLNFHAAKQRFDSLRKTLRPLWCFWCCPWDWNRLESGLFSRQTWNHHCSERQAFQRCASSAAGHTCCCCQSFHQEAHSDAHSSVNDQSHRGRCGRWIGLICLSQLVFSFHASEIALKKLISSWSVHFRNLVRVFFGGAKWGLCTCRWLSDATNSCCSRAWRSRGTWVRWIRDGGSWSGCFVLRSSFQAHLCRFGSWSPLFTSTCPIRSNCLDLQLSWA